MLTHESRASERHKTTQRFQRLGIPITPFIGTGAPSHIANGHNGMRIITAALEARADLLILEDDIDPSPDFPQALAAARELGEAVTFWLCKPYAHPPAWQKAIDGTTPPPPTGFYRVLRLPQWFGTQAILLPHAVVQRAAASPLFGAPNDSFDHWLRDHVLRELFAALPNPVQHRTPTSLVDPRRVPRISPTTHMERRGAWPSTSPT